MNVAEHRMMQLFTFILKIYMRHPAGPITQVARTMQNVIGFPSGIESLFCCKECALQHYVQPVALVAQLQIAGKCIFPEVNYLLNQ